MSVERGAVTDKGNGIPRSGDLNTLQLSYG